jgi:hypothetical protein
MVMVCLTTVRMSASRGARPTDFATTVLSVYGWIVATI